VYESLPLPAVYKLYDLRFIMVRTVMIDLYRTEQYYLSNFCSYFLFLEKKSTVRVDTRTLYYLFILYANIKIYSFSKYVLDQCIIWVFFCSG
jgi:hypothetical protein